MSSIINWRNQAKKLKLIKIPFRTRLIQNGRRKFALHITLKNNSDSTLKYTMEWAKANSDLEPHQFFSTRSSVPTTIALRSLFSNYSITFFVAEGNVTISVKKESPTVCWQWQPKSCRREDKSLYILWRARQIWTGLLQQKTISYSRT